MEATHTAESNNIRGEKKAHSTKSLASKSSKEQTNSSVSPTFFNLQQHPNKQKNIALTQKKKHVNESRTAIDHNPHGSGHREA